MWAYKLVSERTVCLLALRTSPVDDDVTVRNIDFSTQLSCREN
jgi:hypothetical protein